MSAIFGKLNFTTEPVLIEELKIIEDKLRHWRPDDSGIWLDANVGLGHLMLYNTPESLNEQLPLGVKDSGLAITSDARIDNRDEIYSLLALPNDAHHLPDSTLILKLYEQYGEDCVKHLIGDFAFAIWDKPQQKLFCARDHMGVKPFFYYHDGVFFAFASEKKGLLNIPGLDKTINMQFLYNQMYRSVNQQLDTTVYKNIMRLLPAHTLVADEKRKLVKLTRYWDLDADAELKLESDQAYYDAFLAHFKTAVACRLRSAYPIAAELSGGMDSSSITGVASSILKPEEKELITISNTVPDHVTDREIVEKSQRKFITEAIKMNGIKHAITSSSKPMEHVMEEFDFMLEVNDGPDVWEQMWQNPIRQAAQAAGVRTLLSGFPGDEMVTYRGKYYMLDYLDRKQYLKYFLAKKKFPGFSKIDPFIPYRLKYGLHLLKNKLGWFNKMTRPLDRIFNVPNYAVEARGELNWAGYLKEQQFKSYRYFQKHRYLRSHVTARMESETRYGLYFGFEPRFPMADIRLTQFYLSMPNYLKYQGNLDRTAFRRALKDYLPKILLEHDGKTGLLQPYKEESDNAEAIKRRENLSKQLIAEMNEQLKDHPLLKKPVGANGMLLSIFRWLQKHPDSQILSLHRHGDE